jgi:hypothetical protein
MKGQEANMYWSAEITVEKLRKIADDIEAGVVRVQSIEYKADDYGAGVTANLHVRIVEAPKPKEEKSMRSSQSSHFSAPA